MPRLFWLLNRLSCWIRLDGSAMKSLMLSTILFYHKNEYSTWKTVWSSLVIQAVSIWNVENHDCSVTPKMSNMQSRLRLNHRSNMLSCRRFDLPSHKQRLSNLNFSSIKYVAKIKSGKTKLERSKTLLVGRIWEGEGLNGHF